MQPVLHKKPFPPNSSVICIVHQVLYLNLNILMANKRFWILVKSLPNGVQLRKIPPAVLIYLPPPVYARPTNKAEKNEPVMIRLMIKLWNTNHFRFKGVKSFGLERVSTLKRSLVVGATSRLLFWTFAVIKKYWARSPLQILSSLRRFPDFFYKCKMHTRLL